MSQTTLLPERVDDLLSDFFKSKLRQPWPAAPATTFAEPARRSTAQSNRARYTLAASVALLLGTCWYLSNGSHSGTPSPKAVPGGPGILDDGSAKMPKEFEKTRKAKDPVGLPSSPMLD